MLDKTGLDLMARYCVQKYGSAEAAGAVMELYASKGLLTGPAGLRRILGEEYPDYFCKAYLADQFDREFGPFAIEILSTLKRDIEAESREKRVIVAPRGHGKSTLSSYAIPAWAACYQKKRFILFISANFDTSKNFLGKVRKALESPDITEDFGNQVGPTWSMEEICTINGVWIKCAGWKAGLRGMNKDTRPDLLVEDDLEDKETMNSKPMQVKLETCFNEEIGRLGDYNTDFIYIGTLLSEDSLLARTMKNPAWKSLIFKRVTSFPTRGDLWEEWRKIYCDITNDSRFDDAWKFYVKHQKAMLDGVKILWEEKVPAAATKTPGGYYNVMLDRVAFGEDAFWQEDQSEPSKASDKPFKSLSFWNDKYKTLDDACEAARNKILAIDPAEGKGFDNTAYCYGGQLNKGICILKGELRNDKLSAIQVHAVWFLQNFPDITEVHIEENTYKEDGTEQLRKYLSDKGFPVTVKGFRSSTNKYNRIMQMEPDINSGLILFNEDDIDFNTEILRFSSSCAHEDAADVTQLLWSKYKGIGAWMDYMREEAEKVKKQKEAKTA